MDRRLLSGLHQAVQPLCPASGEFNLDFTAIPHWGDASVLEKNWNGSRNKALKSVLAMVVADPDSGLIAYGDADIRHADQTDAVLEFVDFWKAASTQPLKCLIFDSKFTTYQNLSKINQDGIRFITLRRKGQQLIKRVERLPKADWQTVRLDSLTRKYTKLNAHDSRIRLRDYQGELRQVIITGHGRLEPTFIITNDFDLSLKEIVTKYARRWLVEKCLSEQIHFFHLNMLSSSIVIKVDLDLTVSIVAHTLYHLLAKQLPGFEKAEAATIYRNFIETMADIDLQYPAMLVSVPKKTHLPVLFDAPMFKQSHHMPWDENLKLSFAVKNTT
jgi:Transposase DDE domain